jgi:hypothetical protein
MRDVRSVCIAIGLSTALACGGGDDGGDGSIDDPPPACPSGDCGDEAFRRAIPTAGSVRIGFRRPSARTAPGASGGAVSSSQLALEALSPALLEVSEYVDGINGIIDDIFLDLEELAGTTPEIEEETLHQWRGDDPDLPGHEDVLIVTTDDEVTYELELHIGPAGFEPDETTPVMAGTVTVEDEVKSEFHLVIDFDAATAIDPSIDVSGTLDIAAMPFDGGPREIWYDLRDVSFGGEPPETSRTTYWVFAEDSGALEYVAATDHAEATVFARWDGDGGRYDHHAAYDHEELGPVDEIMTNCWDASGAEVFDAWALIDDTASLYGELDGDEADCEFGPVADHPDPGDEFASLPGDGEWDEIELRSLDEEGGKCDLDVDPFAPECPPLCADDPSAPDCTPFCEEEPGAPNCISYCEWFDDPEVCG